MKEKRKEKVKEADFEHDGIAISSEGAFRSSLKKIPSSRQPPCRKLNRPVVRQELSIRSVHFHPEFNVAVYLNNDIAVLTTKDPIQYNERVQPACLPSQTAAYTPGMECVISGRWNNQKRQDIVDNAGLPGSLSSHENVVRSSFVTKQSCQILHQQSTLIAPSVIVSIKSARTVSSIHMYIRSAWKWLAFYSHTQWESYFSQFNIDFNQMRVSAKKLLMSASIYYMLR